MFCVFVSCLSMWNVEVSKPCVAARVLKLMLSTLTPFEGISDCKRRRPRRSD